MQRNILVLAQKGGVSKSTLCDEIAFSLERTKTPLVFYDLDGQGGPVHRSTQEPDPNAEIAVIDTPGAFNPENIQQWIETADLIIIPTKPTMMDQPVLERTRQTVHTYAPKTPIILVISMSNHFTTAKNFTDWLASTLQKNETLISIPASESVPQARIAEMSVTEYAKRTNVASKTREFTNVVREKIGLPREDELPMPTKRTKKSH